MNKLNYEILSAIDNIETTVMESEMNVMNSLIASYDKAVMILECCDDNTDTSSYDIFQESVIMEADNNGNGKKKIDFKKAGKIIKNILLWLQKQIMRFVEFIRNKIRKSKTLKVSKDDIIVEYFCYYDLIKHYQKVFNEIKSFININDFIDIDFTDKEKYIDIANKMSKILLQMFGDGDARCKKSTYAEYLKYYNDTMKMINDMVSSMEEFGNKLNEQINREIDNLNKAIEATNDCSINHRLHLIVHYLNEINKSFTKVLSEANESGIQWFIEENEKVNKMVESIISERNN